MIDCPECGSSDTDVAPASAGFLFECQDCGHQFNGDDDIDPLCICGTARSEHQLCGCPEGFQRSER